MIEVKDLYVGYDGKPILRDITLCFPRGKVTVLIGPNGCGKSTLLRTVLALMPKLGGQIFYDGVNADTITGRQIARQAAFLSQSRNVPDIIVNRMVLHGRFAHLSFPRQYRPQDKAIAREALRLADAADLEDRFVQRLSGGQRQKVYLAMALAQKTETIFMDEPTTFMDIRHQLDVMHIAHCLAQEGKAVVMVLHDLCLAMRAADYLVVLAQGKIQMAAAPQEVFAAGVISRVFGVSLSYTQTPRGRRYYYGD